MVRELKMPTATNISGPEAERIKYLPDNTVLISINEVDDELWRLHLDRLSSKVLTVRFPDITAKLEYKGNLLLPISVETALKIINFVNINQDKNFIIHCAAGISRSAAVALFINREYGHELKPDFWRLCHPNPYVLGLLTRERHSKKYS